MKRKLVILAVILALVALPLVAACARAPAPAPTLAPAPTVTVTVTAPAPAATPAPTPTAAPAKVFEWKYFDPYGSANWISQQSVLIVKDLLKVTNGQVKPQVFFAGEHPIATSDLLDAVSKRRAEMSYISGSWFTGTEPLLATLYMPMIFPGGHPPTFEQGREVMQAVSDKFVTNHVAEKWGVTILGGYLSPALEISTSVPITGKDSLKGIKIRVVSGSDAKLVEYLGGVGVTIPWGETPSALATGTAAGLVTMLTAVYDIKAYDYVKYTTLLGLDYSPNFLVVNNQALAELPADVRKAVLETGLRWGQSLGGAYWQMDNERLRIMVEQRGLTVTGVSAKFRQELVDYAKMTLRPDYLKLTGAKGQQVLDLIDSITAQWK